MSASTADLLKKIRKIEIKTRGLSNQIFSGEYHSAFKGRGMAFSEVREYVPGDEVRTIDWNVTARFNQPFVKVFEEERELTVMLLVDVSASTLFGTKSQEKKEIITEICAILAFSAINNNDKAGVILYSDKIEKFIPPKKGKSHILRIIKELLEFEPTSGKTDTNQALRYFNNIVKKRSIAFILSDFLDDNYEDALKLTNRKHDMVGFKVTDPAEIELPNMGYVKFSDPESKEDFWINTSSASLRKDFAKKAAFHRQKTTEIMKKSGVDFAEILTDRPYIKPLMNLFKKRAN
ncbi:MAG: DUF58 domain-containing protein [Luteibaculaceae bacterium]